MATTRLGQYTYTTTASNRVIVTGPGMPDNGGDLGNLSNLSAAAFLSLASSPGVSAGGENYLRFMANQGDWTQVKEALAFPPNVQTEPLPPTVTNAPSASTQLNGTVADEDNGQGQPNPVNSSAIPAAPTSTANGQGGTTGGTDNVVQGSDGQATQNLRTAPSDEATPGKRLKNPLGYFASYTYQLSLYMITPDAYNAFILSGRKRIDALNSALRNNTDRNGAGGAFLIAQSGGINNTNSTRPPGEFQFDYYIDNLSFNTSVNAKANATNSNTTTVKFTITEPNGFSFLTKLRNASDAMQEYAAQIGKTGPENPSKQFFILGIRFFGYDEAGNQFTGQENFDGTTLDPNAYGNGLFETYFDILITSVKFKIDGKATTYQISANSLGPQSAFTVKRGLINSNQTITASTVGEGIQQLFDKLNKEQQDKVKNKVIGIANNYRVTYLGEAETIGSAKLTSPEDLDKFKLPGSGAKTTTQSSEATAQTATPDTTKTTITFNPSTPTLEAINRIVTQSTFLRNALKVVYDTSLEPNPTKGGFNQNKPGSKKQIKWFNISVEITNAQWDELSCDWAYDMNYILQTYELPVLDSAYANGPVGYYGPHKRYQYWYTGKNSEVLAYEHQLDNTYFNVVLDSSVGSESAGGGGSNTTNPPPAGTGNSTNGPTNVPRVTGQRTSQPRLGKLGNAMEAQNNFLTSLYDPGAYTKAKITILGDPDFLIQDSATSENQIYSRFYGPNGFTVNPNGGQVFIEIDFKEPIDYESKTGTLKLNDSILFWKYPDSVSKKIKGVSYKIITITSTFSNGSFKQVIDASINDFGDEDPDKKQQRTESTTANATGTGNGPAPGNSNTTTNATGLKSDNPSNQNKSATVGAASKASPSQAPQQNTTRQGVADDDNQPIIDYTTLGSG